MSNINEFYPELPLVCLSPVRHGKGRRPSAPYQVGDTAMCRACILLLASQSRPQTPIHIRAVFPPISPVIVPPSLAKLPGQCLGEHSKIVRAEAILDAKPLCWDCIDAILRLGSTHILKSLPSATDKIPT